MDIPLRLTLVAVWTALWCVGHSLFATHGFGRRLRALFPRYHVLQRVAYVVASSFSLAVLFVWLRTLPQNVLWEWTGIWAWVRWAGLAEAAVLFWLGSRCYSGAEFLGLAQLRGDGSGNLPARTLRRDGILGVIRHPWYTGSFMLLAFCLPYTDVNLVWRLVFALYLVAGTELEERKLLREIGATYADYRREVPRFFPRLWGQKRS